MQPLSGVATKRQREAVAGAVERIHELNVERGDDFQDLAVARIDTAREAFREGVEGELPGTGADPLLDRLMALARQLDASPEAVQAACDHVLAPIEEAPAEHGSRT